MVDDVANECQPAGCVVCKGMPPHCEGAVLRAHICRAHEWQRAHSRACATCGVCTGHAPATHLLIGPLRRPLLCVQGWG